MSSADNEYFRARAADERAMAAKASNPTIAKIHLQLAEKYESLLQDTAPATSRFTEVDLGRAQSG